MSRTIISTPHAPAAIGTYSQAVKVGSTVYLSGQIALDPQTMQLKEGIEAQVIQVFDNLKAVCEASGGSLQDIAKLNIFLTDLANFALVLPFITQHLFLLLDEAAIVHNMHQAYEQIQVDASGFGLFIAGPSKTADIEQSLVIGAQGARSLTVVLEPPLTSG